MNLDGNHHHKTLREHLLDTVTRAHHGGWLLLAFIAILVAMMLKIDAIFPTSFIDTLLLIFR